MQNTYIKILFRTDSADWHGYNSELLWARPLDSQETSGAFELQNSPFYVKGVSCLDIVKAVNKDGLCEFAGVIASSGHSTYRLIVERGSTEFAEWWGRLQSLGCTYESGEFRGKELFSVDVPAPTDIYDVYGILEEGEKLGVWFFEEGHVGHTLNKPQLPKTNT